MVRKAGIGHDDGIDSLETTEALFEVAFRRNDESALMKMPKPFHSLHDFLGTLAVSWTTAKPRLPGYIPPGQPFPSLAALPQLSDTEGDSSIWLDRYISTGTDRTGNQKRRTSAMEITCDSQGRILCPLSDALDGCGCGDHLETAADAVAHIYAVFDGDGRGTRRCPFCTSTAVEKRTELRFGNGKNKAGTVRHLKRHFPADVPCKYCTHLSKNTSDMIAHVKKVHADKLAQESGGA